MKQGLSKEQDKQHSLKMEPLIVKVWPLCLISTGHLLELSAMAEHMSQMALGTVPVR